VQDRSVLGGIWSHSCGLEDLQLPAVGGGEVAAEELLCVPGWANRWTTRWRLEGTPVTCPVRDMALLPLAGAEPVRRFTWRPGQRHRPGLQYLVSTGRHHGFESMEEQRLLIALDFAGELVDLLPQPFRLRFETRLGWRETFPDFLVLSRRGRWLVNVKRPGGVRHQHNVSFAAVSEAALVAGWRHVLVAGWQPNVMGVLDTLSSQRRVLADPLGLQGELLAAATAQPQQFGELVDATSLPAVARAHALHLLWRRQLSVDLSQPLTSQSEVLPVAAGWSQ
jgi:hypothetical protein